MGACCSTEETKKKPSGGGSPPESGHGANDHKEVNKPDNTQSNPPKTLPDDPHNKPNAKEDLSDSEADPEQADDSDLITLNEGIRDFYDIGKEIGTGGYSIVYEGKNKSNGDMVAIKCIDLCMIESEATPGVDPLLPLKREIKIMKKIDHPNIIKLFEVFADDEKFYMVMELIPGEELFQLIEKNGSFSEKHASKVFREVVSAVAYLHDMGIAHRDLKPENILIQTEGDVQTVKLADFGFAKYFKEDQLKTALGSPGYAAPELFTEDSYNESVDMWSLGVIAFVLLSGSPPFYGETIKELTDKIISAEFDFDDPCWENISEAAKSLVCHLLVKDPAKRYTAKQCKEDPWVMGVGLE